MLKTLMCSQARIQKRHNKYPSKGERNNTIVELSGLRVRGNVMVVRGGGGGGMREGFSHIQRVETFSYVYMWK